MLTVGILMAILPFFIFISLAGTLSATAGDPRLIGTLILGGAILMYLISLGTFALVQKLNCRRTDFPQVAGNAGYATLIYSGFTILAAVFPALRNVVTNIISPEVETNVRDSLAYGYYSFWGALFGTAIGGTLSGICK